MDYSKSTILFSVLISLCNLFVTNESQYIHPKIENYEYFANEQWLKVDVMPHRFLTASKLMTNALYGSFAIFDDIPCDTPFNLSLTPKIRGMFLEKPTLSLDSYLERVAEEDKHANDFFKNCIKSIRSSISPTLSCPLQKGNYTIQNMVIQSNLDAILLNNKIWNVTFVMTANTGEQILKFWLELELDDTDRNKARKPTQAQVNERERKAKQRRKLNTPKEV